MLVLLLGAACSKAAKPGASGESCDPNPTPLPPQPIAGETLFSQKCAVCHGETGDGGLGPAVKDNPRSESDLATYIDAQMPLGNPDACDAACSASIAHFMKAQLTTSALQCGTAPHVSPRRLRLLTRREYRETVRDLFAQVRRPPTHCSKDTDCAFDQSCDGGYCSASTCDSHEFVFDPKGATHASVQVAGSFNGWPATAAAGGWALTYSAQTGLWTGNFEIPAGASSYKFVVDGSTWVADSRDPDSVSDGYGGSNSALTSSCPTDDPAANVPAEPRPDGFVFDDASDAALVTSDHIDAYFAAAESLGAAAADLPLGCDAGTDAATCAKQFVANFGARAFRRPLADAEVTRYATLLTAESDPVQGKRIAIEAMLLSPSFLYRSEIGVPQADGSTKLDGYEVASALSYMLWGTMPDQALFDAAGSGALDTPAGIETQARRMLANPRARRTLGTFASQWLGTENVTGVDKNASLYPAFTDAIRHDMDEEARRFVAHVAFDSTAHAFSALLTSDDTQVNDELAAFYGLPTKGTPGFHTASWPAGTRPGVLGEGAMLATWAHSDQTSPVKRGLFVRRRLLCEDLPPPPPNVGSVPAVDPNSTTRQRFQQHDANEACASCHTYIDHVGFGFEHYDPVGLYRDTENGMPIDASGDMSDVDGLGTNTHATFTTLGGLAQTLGNSPTPTSCFTRQYLRFARGYHETLADRCARGTILDTFHQHGGDIQELMIAVTKSPDFVVRK